MKPTTLLWTLILAAFVVAGCSSPSDRDDDDHRDGRSPAAHDDDGDEEEIALSAVPANVLAAAEAALPGATFEEAEIETENGVTVYCLEGVKDGVEWEIEVSADGRVLEVERDDDDEDEDDEHDDD